MKKLLLILIFSVVTVFAGYVEGTVRNMTIIEDDLYVVALGVDMTDLLSAPMSRISDPHFPQDYRIEDEAIENFNPYFVLGYMVTNPFLPIPASGDPFGAYELPVLPIGGGASDIDIVLWSDGDIGGNISYYGSYENVTVIIYDMYTSFFGDPTIEIVRHIGDNEYYIPFVPAGPKIVTAFDDINENGRLDDGEPSGTYSMPLVGVEIVLCSGSLSEGGIDITIGEAITENQEKVFSASASIYPNPTYNGFKVEYKLPRTNYSEITISSINGKTIYRDIISGTGEIVYDENLPQGVYLYTIQGESVFETGKINVIR